VAIGGPRATRGGPSFFDSATLIRSPATLLVTTSSIVLADPRRHRSPWRFSMARDRSRCIRALVLSRSSSSFFIFLFRCSLKMPSDSSLNWTRETRQIYKINENDSSVFSVYIDIHSSLQIEVTNWEKWHD